MTGSTIPGMTADVVRADIASRQQEAQERRHTAEMARELRAVRREVRRARRHPHLSAPRPRPAWLLGLLPHDSTA